MPARATRASFMYMAMYMDMCSRHVHVHVLRLTDAHAHAHAAGTARTPASMERIPNMTKHDPRRPNVLPR